MCLCVFVSVCVCVCVCVCVRTCVSGLCVPVHTCLFMLTFTSGISSVSNFLGLVRSLARKLHFHCQNVRLFNIIKLLNYIHCNVQILHMRDTYFHNVQPCI